jgi:hypothetical protein
VRHDERTPGAGDLEPLIGSWTVEAEFASLEPSVVRGRTTFDWLLGRRFVLQRAEMDHPDAPDGQMVLAPDPARPGGYLQHYFDSRGVVRLYEMGFDGRTWTLTRRAPDFSPLDFAQRFTADLGDDGDSLSGAWYTAPDGVDWRLDFRLTYRRTG